MKFGFTKDGRFVGSYDCHEVQSMGVTYDPMATSLIWGIATPEQREEISQARREMREGGPVKHIVIGGIDLGCNLIVDPTAKRT